MEHKFAKVQSFGRYSTGTPLISELFSNNAWILFGAGNDYPQELLRLYQNASVLHKTLIDRKTQLVAGNGFTTDTEFTKNVFSKESLDLVAVKATYDYFIFGGFYLNVIWDKAGKKIVQIEHIPYEKMRVAKCDSEKDEMEGFYFSRDWLKYRRKESTPKFMPELNQEFAKEFPSQVIFFKTYCPGLDFYTEPQYSPALNDLKTDYEISTYHLKNLQNGMRPGMIIVNKSGIPTAEEMEVVNIEMEAAFSGTENAGRFINVYAETADKAPEFIPVQPTNSDQQFKDLRESIDNIIMRAHSMTSGLAGIEVSGKLGSSQEIMEQLQFLQSTIIDPAQKNIAGVFNKILMINGSDERVELKKFELTAIPNDVTQNNNK